MRLLRDILVLGIAAFFAVMWGMLLRENVILAPSQPVRPNYERLLGEGEESRTILLGIYRGSARLGRTRTTITRGEGGLALESDTRFELGNLIQFMAPDAQNLEITFSADISLLTGLRYMRVNCPQLDVALRGFVRDEQLMVRGRVGGQRISRQIPYGRQPFLGDVLSPMSGLPDLDRASPDDTWTMHVVNPILGGVQQVRVRLVRTLSVEVGDRDLQVHELQFEGGGRSWRSCVSGDGGVLVQGTPFGLTLRRENISAELTRFLRRHCLETEGTGGR